MGEAYTVVLEIARGTVWVTATRWVRPRPPRKAGRRTRENDDDMAVRAVCVRVYVRGGYMRGQAREATAKGEERREEKRDTGNADHKQLAEEEHVPRPPLL